MCPGVLKDVVCPRFPAIERRVLDMPGDIVARPHANCYWVIPGRLLAGETPYVHCWGGAGRTGTVVGCLLRAQGFDAAAALAVIERRWGSMEKRNRHPFSPETAEQVAFIEQRLRG